MDICTVVLDLRL